jgi:hypothetical protein
MAITMNDSKKDDHSEKKERRKDRTLIVACPSCDRTHAFGRNGAYCAMRCYYNKLYGRTEQERLQTGDAPQRRTRNGMLLNISYPYPKHSKGTDI